MRKNQNRVFNSEAELHLAVMRWDEEFSARMKDKKFESYKINKGIVSVFRPAIVEGKDV